MKKINLQYSSVAMSIMAMTALVSTATVNAQEVTEEIVVTGTRATIQSSIDQKRISTEIVDGLSSDEIGDIPALSIGEALETLTGVSSNRENGGASAISIRGLGPFLTNTVLNGRTATNGSGDRAVNFSIFPSELFNKIGVFKTQSASFIEGAVAGQVRLETKRPLDHGKQSIQLSAKAAYNENEQNISGGDDFGYRGTISYIDQFETEDFGSFGISLGVQTRDETNPEAEFRTSGTARICNLDPVTGAPTGGNCADGQNFLRGLVDDGNGNFATDEDRESFAFLTSSATFRQNVTEDERNSFFGAVQWQPNEKLDINLDAQFSERIQGELRSDLVFAELNRNLDDAFNNGTFVLNDDNTLRSFTGAGQEIRLIGQDFERDEEYNAIGLNVEYQVSDDLKVSFDASYSNTERVEIESSFEAGDNVDRIVSSDFSTLVPILSATNPDGTAFDPTNVDEFLDIGGNVDRLRFRDQLDVRENTITALRGDFELQTHNLGFIKSVEGGVRFSQLEFERRGNNTISTEFDELGDGAVDENGNAFSDADLLANQTQILNAISINCFNDLPESDFLEEELNGRTLGGNFSSFLSIDSNCARDQAFSISEANGISLNGQLEGSDEFNSGSIDVEEDTFAAYLQANFETTLFGLPARGNFGARLVNTSVDSRTFLAPAVALDFNDNGSFEIDELGGELQESNESFSYTELLPSATLVVDLSDTVLFRSGIFRGISRSAPTLLGARQELSSVQQNIADTNDNLNITLQDVEGFLSTQGSTGGNVDLAPFTSWNVDLALEWYPNKDTILSAGVYYKKFRGGFQNSVQDASFTLFSDGSADSEQVFSTLSGGAESIDFTVPLNSFETTSESSNLYGLEFTASHAFSYLPGFLGGFGTKLSYNYASSDFEIEDDIAGGGVGVNAAGEQQDLIGLIPPADIFGLSRNVASAQLYWSGGKFDAQVIAKHRSKYFQQFNDDPARLRFVDDNTVVELRASYKVNSAVKLTFEALNITDEPRVDFRGVDGNINQVLTFGPRYFIGIQAKL